MELIGTGIAALSLMLTTATFIWDKLLSRKQRTLETLNKLKDSYHREIAGRNRKDNSDYYRNCVSYFGKLESFCSGVLSGYYSYRTVKSSGSRLIIRLYDDFKVYLIDQRRKQFKDDESYISIERLAEKFRRSRGAANGQETNSPSEKTNSTDNIQTEE